MKERKKGRVKMKEKCEKSGEKMVKIKLCIHYNCCFYFNGNFCRIFTYKYRQFSMNILENSAME